MTARPGELRRIGAPTVRRHLPTGTPVGRPIHWMTAFGLRGHLLPKIKITEPPDLLAPLLHHVLLLADSAAGAGQPLDAPEILSASSHQRREGWHPRISFSQERSDVAFPSPLAVRKGTIFDDQLKGLRRRRRTHPTKPINPDSSSAAHSDKVGTACCIAGGSASNRATQVVIGLALHRPASRIRPSG